MADEQQPLLASGSEQQPLIPKRAAGPSRGLVFVAVFGAALLLGAAVSARGGAAQQPQALLWRQDGDTPIARRLKEFGVSAAAIKRAGRAFPAMFQLASEANLERTLVRVALEAVVFGLRRPNNHHANIEAGRNLIRQALWIAANLGRERVHWKGRHVVDILHYQNIIVEVDDLFVGGLRP